MGASCAVWANASATIRETTRNAEDSARIVSLAAMYWASQYDQEFARKSSPWCAYPNDSSEHARTVRMRESRVGEDDRGRLATPFDQRTSAPITFRLTRVITPCETARAPCRGLFSEQLSRGSVSHGYGRVSSSPKRL